MAAMSLRSIVSGASLVMAAAFVAFGCDSPKAQPTPAPDQQTSELKKAELEAKIKAEIAAKRAEEEKTKAAEAALSAGNIECADGKNVDFHHKGLEQEIRRKLEKPEGTITKAELAKVKSVNLAKGDSLDYLDPCVFPYLTGVKDLFLGPGKLNDISGLNKLIKLESLRATANQVSDISVLANLKLLDRLDLANTLVSDISVLSGLTKLTELQLDGSKVTDISPLTDHPALERLTLNRTGVKDVSPLRGVKTLKHLNVSGAAVTDPETLARRGLEIVDD
jgi:internalin A